MTVEVQLAVHTFALGAHDDEEQHRGETSIPKDFDSKN
jgi:hypothetical protein